MATTFINQCDHCGAMVDIVYLDEETGLELCINCLYDFDDYDEDFDD
jgi:recombinational DNA repair protein (RecF pathway)